MILAFWTVLTVPAVVIAILAGATAGYLLGSLYPPNPLIPRRRTLSAFILLGFIGIVFFIGQTIEVYFGSAGELWTRVAARGVLWLLFSASLAIAGIIAQTRRWKI